MYILFLKNLSLTGFLKNLYNLLMPRSWLVLAVEKAAAPEKWLIQ